MTQISAGRLKIIKLVFTLFVAGAAFIFLPPDCPDPARRMAFIFVIAALFWALEIIPLFATSLIVILLQAFLLAKAGGVIGIAENDYTVFLIPFANPVIMLFLGGFVLAKAFQKYKIDRWIAAHLLRLFGTKPFFVLLGFMIATAFLSMWISNTATTALMIAMIFPLLSNLEQDDPYKKALVLAVAFAAMIGGVATPVGTPPNAIAIGFLAERGIYLNFLSWMLMATPLAVVLIVITCVLLYCLFPARKRFLDFRLGEGGPFSGRAKLVLILAALTAFLWMSAGWHKIPEALVALLAAGLLCAFSLIDRSDFRSIEWDILVLMWGGLALGEGMEKSGLARWIIGLPIFSYDGFGLIVVFCLTAVLLSTFMSNTATVNLLIPIALSIPGQNPVVMATVIALASSFDIALPIATPPMAIAYGTGEIPVRDMLKAGIVVSLIANVLLLIGFQFFIANVLVAK